jgi:hypothetical protein
MLPSLRRCFAMAVIQLLLLLSLSWKESTYTIVCIELLSVDAYSSKERTLKCSANWGAGNSSDVDQNERVCASSKYLTRWKKN